MAHDITRRALLGAGSSLTIMGAVGMAASQVLPADASAAVPVPQSAELHRLIAASRAAEAAWHRAADEADVLGLDATTKRLKEEAASAAGRHARAALLDLLGFGPSSIEELRDMIAFLREPRGPWDEPERIDQGEVTILLDAIMAGRA